MMRFGIDFTIFDMAPYVVPELNGHSEENNQGQRTKHRYAAEGRGVDAAVVTHKLHDGQNQEVKVGNSTELLKERLGNKIPPRVLCSSHGVVAKLPRKASNKCVCQTSNLAQMIHRA